MPDYILAYDVGTTGAKAALLRPSGSLDASSSHPYETFYSRSGWAEQDPQAWWQAVVESTREIIERVPACGKEIAAIGVSGQMLGCIPVDEKGSPLRNAMIHSDTRAISQWERLSSRLGLKRIYAISGNRLGPQSTICKIMWLKDEEKSAYKNAFKFIQCKDYVTVKLTGTLGPTDYSDASHSVLMDVTRREWSAELLEAAKIKKGKLPELSPSAAVQGHLHKAAARTLGLPSGIPVVVGGGDGACASMGAGAVSPGCAYTYLGGTGWISLALDRPFIDPKMRVFNILGLDPGTCGVYGTVQSAGSAHRWVADLMNVRSYRRLDDMIEEAPIGSDGLFFLPYLMGERTPLWDPYARGVYFGLSLSHGRSQVARATIEGVSYALKSVFDTLEEATPIREMRLIGGGARSKAWRSILASIYGRDLLLTRTVAQATCYGAAIAAGVGVGLFADYQDGVSRMSRISDQSSPDRDSHETYRRLFQFWKSLYPRLKSAYRELHDLLEEDAS